MLIEISFENITHERNVTHWIPYNLLDKLNISLILKISQQVSPWLVQSHAESIHHFFPFTDQIIRVACLVLQFIVVLSFIRFKVVLVLPCDYDLYEFFRLFHRLFDFLGNLIENPLSEHQNGLGLIEGRGIIRWILSLELMTQIEQKQKLLGLRWWLLLWDPRISSSSSLFFCVGCWIMYWRWFPLSFSLLAYFSLSLWFLWSYFDFYEGKQNN